MAQLSPMMQKYLETKDKRYWKEANAEFDKYKNSQKKK